MQSAHQENEYHIASFVAQANQENLADVQEKINLVVGAEVHAVSPEGKIVFTIEDNNQHKISQKVEELKYCQGMLTIAPVYHQFLPEAENT